MNPLRTYGIPSESRILQFQRSGINVPLFTLDALLRMRFVGNTYVIRIFLGILLLTSLIGFQCTSVPPIRSLGQDHFALDVSFGGPLLTNLGAPIPAPQLATGIRYGVSSDFDLSATLNLIPLILPGLLDFSTHFSWIPIQPGLRFQKKTSDIGFQAGGSLIFRYLTNFRDGLFIFPALDIAAGYRYRWINPFLGSEWIYHGDRPFNKNPAWMIQPYLGVDLIFSPRASLLLKATLYDSAFNHYGSQIDWVYLVNRTETSLPKKQAIFGFSLGFSWRFQPKKRIY